jgi:hypothetical protein
MSEESKPESVKSFIARLVKALNDRQLYLDKEREFWAENELKASRLWGASEECR